jgi:hypothetical protein
MSKKFIHDSDNLLNLEKYYNNQNQNELKIGNEKEK